MAYQPSRKPNKGTQTYGYRYKRLGGRHYFTPKDLSDVLSPRNNGPIRPATKALASVLGSVIPDMYKAAAQLAAALKYDNPAAIACSFMVLLLSALSLFVIILQRYAYRWQQ
jgi:hypothetical protein